MRYSFYIETISEVKSMTLLTNALIDLQCELVAERNMKNPQNIS